MSKKKILFFYDYFFPGYKAGGPVQSLTNLAIALKDEFEVFIVTGSADIGDDKAYAGIETNKWNDIILKDSTAPFKIYYADLKCLNLEVISGIMQQIKPVAIYLNGIYSQHYFLNPLRFSRKILKNECKVVVCPRGMLQQGALAVKPVKKRVYLWYLRLSGLLDNVVWHAINQEELTDIQSYFTQNSGIIVAPNVPREPLREISFPVKEAGKLRLVYMSLITEKKNLYGLLQVVAKAGSNIRLDIYGPVIDEKYWKKCLSLIDEMRGNVTYKGELQPVEVQQVLQEYDAFILLTKGENFGHSIYESLSVGRPVITSNFTPWKNLKEHKAGVNVDINDHEDCINKIKFFTNLKQEEYYDLCDGAHGLACSYYNNLETLQKYKQLF